MERNIKKYNKKIIDYYDNTKFDYQKIMNLNKNKHLHYAFFDKNNLTLKKALDNTTYKVGNELKIKKTDFILDVGCGIGGSAILLAKKYGCKIIGITLSQDQVNIANENIKKQNLTHLVKIKKMDFLKTEFKEKTFDKIYGIESVCHAFSKKIFLKEAKRILKENGEILLSDFFTPNEYCKNDKTLKKFQKCWEVNFFENIEIMKKFSKDLNFRKVSYKDKKKKIKIFSIYLITSYYFSFIINYFLLFLKYRNEIQNKNFKSARLQYICFFKKKILTYGFFHLIK